jgi:hypothetical protein
LKTEVSESGEKWDDAGIFMGMVSRIDGYTDGRDEKQHFL